jgi:hypothetical protein
MNNIMENIERDPAQDTSPKKTDWHKAELEEFIDDTSMNNSAMDDDYQSNRHEIQAANDDPEDEEEDDTEEEDNSGDWGHVDPAEGNSPFPDSKDPSGPGSAV